MARMMRRAPMVCMGDAHPETSGSGSRRAGRMKHDVGRRARPSTWRRAGVITVITALLFAIATSVACGTEAVGVDACRRIEKVRCESAQACGIDLGKPVHEGNTPEKNVAACVRYYDDQCLHGLVTPKEPGPQAVDACVNAIINGDCTIVKSPESHPDCRFLVPPAPAPAPPDAAAAEASASSG